MSAADEHLAAANVGGLVGAARRYRKKPVVVEAIHFDGTYGSCGDVIAWSGGKVVEMMGHPDGRLRMQVVTPEGNMIASPGDWIVLGTEGEYYPVKPDAFAATFEPA